MKMKNQELEMNQQTERPNGQHCREKNKTLALITSSVVGLAHPARVTWKRTDPAVSSHLGSLVGTLDRVKKERDSARMVGF